MTKSHPLHFTSAVFLIAASMLIAVAISIKTSNNINNYRSFAFQELTHDEKAEIMGAGPGNNCNFSKANITCTGVSPNSGSLEITTCAQTSPAPPPAAGCGGDTSCGTGNQFCSGTNSSWLCVSVNGNGNIQACTPVLAQPLVSCGNRMTGGACSQVGGTCTCTGGSVVTVNGNVQTCQNVASLLTTIVCP
jgi:hypothetical protein